MVFEVVWIGYIAAIFSTISLMPQVVKSLKMRETRDLSMPMLIIMIIGVSLWLAYGLLISDTALIAANSVTAPLIISLIILKLRYG